MVKIFSKKKTLGLDSLIRNSTECWREEIIQIQHKVSQRIEDRRRETTSKFILWDHNYPYTKIDQDIKIKESCRTIHFMNVDAEILSKIFTNQT